MPYGLCGVKDGGVRRERAAKWSSASCLMLSVINDVPYQSPDFHARRQEPQRRGQAGGPLTGCGRRDCVGELIAWLWMWPR